MNTLLTHPHEFFRVHGNSASAADRVSTHSSFVRKIIDRAEKIAELALVVIIGCVTIMSCAKFLGAATLAVYYCDLCTFLPLVLAAP